MVTSSTRSETYNDLHNDFSQSYHVINQYVIDLYTLPKKFIDETGPVLDRFLKEYSIPGAPRPKDLPTQSVLDFIAQIDDFTCETVGLFEYHKQHVNACSTYMRKVVTLRNQQLHVGQSELDTKFAELTPEVISLNGALNDIKGKADEMVNRLEKLEMRWLRMRSVINA